MTNYFTLLPSLIVVLLMSQTSVLATKTVADDLGESESPIDIMGTVADHDYFTFFGTKLYLPRIFLWEDANGKTQFSTYKSTQNALASGEFEQVDHGIKPVNGSILVDFSLTSHLIFLVWTRSACSIHSVRWLAL